MFIISHYLYNNKACVPVCGRIYKNPMTPYIGTVSKYKMCPFQLRTRLS